ncbi:MAG: hypothetical protein M1835_007240 [Candelina submexicana]|nr:MAG: hypothetical protein M1835_007240 [Candelina submexicana]
MRDEVLESAAEPFAIPEFHKSPMLDQFVSTSIPSLLFPAFTPLELDSRIGSLSSSLDLKGLELPDLSSFGYGPLEEVYTPEDTTSLSATEQSAPALSEVGDIWRFALDELSEEQVVPYHSWENFLGFGTVELPTGYVSEGGPQVFDAVLAQQTDKEDVDYNAGEAIHLGAFIQCLHHLGLGRSSLLFEYNKDKRRFYATMPDARISGYTSVTTQSIQSKFLGCGNKIRHLEEFVADTYTSRNTPRCLVALSDAVSTTLATLQRQLSISSPIESIPQLQSLFHRPGLVVGCLMDIFSGIASSTSDEQLLSILYEKIQQIEHGSSWLRSILLEVLRRVSKPWLEFVGEWVGLHKELGVVMDKKGPSRSFVKIEHRTWIDDRGLEMGAADYIFDNEIMPTFITYEDAHTIFECGKSVRLLKEHHPDHPLSRLGSSLCVATPHLDWRFSWEDLDKIELKSKLYEQELIAAIQHYTTHENRADDYGLPINDVPENNLEIFGKTKNELRAHIQASSLILDQPLLHSESVRCDDLRDLLGEHLLTDAIGSSGDSNTFAPPISLTPLLSFCPLVSTQARLVNSECLRLFFVEHKLRKHLNLQRRYHLFGDGVFLSQLSHALFDPEYESAERRKGVTRSGQAMGLRLGSRETWPPASSELRLALMDVLTGSYLESSGQVAQCISRCFSRTNELPGGLSFSVRELNEEEIEKCLQPDSIEALDFLRLQYKPPSPLEAIITPTCLYKYDCVFKTLLRAVRMLYTVNQLFRNAFDRISYWRGIDNVAQSFRIEAHHFVATVCEYFFQVGINATWLHFDAKLDRIEKAIKYGPDGVLGHSEGLHSLRDFHERVLDKMIFSLFLRKRQQPVMALLEEIFTIILGFARYSRNRATGLQRRQGDSEEVRHMHTKFRKRLGVFISVCRGLSEKRGYGERSVRSMESDGRFESDELADGGNTIGQLLLKLEMTLYYSELASK